MGVKRMLVKSRLVALRSISGFAAASLVLMSMPLPAQERFITVASTTSTEQSGLFKHLLPMYQQKTGVQVRVVALGTGQALDLARRGDADVWAGIEANASPTGRAGTPQDLVGAALLLCSDAGAYIAGADLMVTGAGHLPGW